MLKSKWIIWLFLLSLLIVGTQDCLGGDDPRPHDRLGYKYVDDPNGQFLFGIGLEHMHLGAGYYFTETLMAFGQLDVGYRFRDLGFGIGGGIRPVQKLEFQLGVSYLVLDRKEQNIQNEQTEQITAIVAGIYHVSNTIGLRVVYTHNLGVNFGIAIKF